MKGGLSLTQKKTKNRFIHLVRDMAPSAEEEPCEDAVSREAVSEWLKQYGQDVLHGKYKFSLMYIWKNLMDLPSAQPERKIGKWLRSGNCIFPYECDQCGDTNERATPFCPNCGAKMRGEKYDIGRSD